MSLFVQHLEESVNSGLISRHENKGNISYKDPESCPRSGNSKGLKLSPSCDLTKVIAINRINEVASVSYAILFRCLSRL